MSFASAPSSEGAGRRLLGRRAAAQGAAGSACLASMARAANDEAFPLVVNYTATPADVATPCAKVDPTYACVDAASIAVAPVGADVKHPP